MERTTKTHKTHKRKKGFTRTFRRIARRLLQWPPRKALLFGSACIALIVTCIAVIIVLRGGTGQKDKSILSATALSPSPTAAFTPTPIPTMTAAPTPNPLDGVVIKSLGETNDLLPVVQERLTELSYMDMPVDGYTSSYDSATKIGVLLFQIKNYEDSTQWDGQLGAGTFELLMSDQAKAYYLGRGDGDDRTKIITKLVKDVKTLQDRLIALGYMSITRASGYYGGSTVEAVQAFQQFHGLSPDGRAGQETLTLLYSEEAMDYKTGKQNDLSKRTPTPAPTVSLAE